MTSPVPNHGTDGVHAESKTRDQRFVMKGHHCHSCHELFYVDPGQNDPRVYAGQGTIGYEIALQHPSVDTIVVPVGSGGLITGVAVGARAIKPEMRIVGVQTAACPSLYQRAQIAF